MNDSEYMRRVRGMEGRLYRIAQSMLWRDADAMDAVQEAVFRGWMKKDRLRDPDRFEAWLTRILVNQCRDMMKRRRREPAALDADVPGPERLCEDVQLRLALKKLPEQYRLPLVLHYMEGFQAREIARMLKTSRTTVEWRLRQARKALRDLLDGGDGE